MKWCNEGCILVDVFLNIQSSLCSFPPLLLPSFPPLPPLLLSSIYGSVKMQWVSFQKSPIHKFLVCVCLYVCARTCEFGSSEQSAHAFKRTLGCHQQGALWSLWSPTFHLWRCQGQQLSFCSCRWDQHMQDNLHLKGLSSCKCPYPSFL